jgi:hypothetical protein
LNAIDLDSDMVTVFEKIRENETNKILNLSVPEISNSIVREVKMIVCPACGEEMLANVYNGRVRGWCATSKRYVDFAAGR